MGDSSCARRQRLDMNPVCAPRQWSFSPCSAPCHSNAGDLGDVSTLALLCSAAIQVASFVAALAAVALFRATLGWFARLRKSQGRAEAMRC